MLHDEMKDTQYSVTNVQPNIEYKEFSLIFWTKGNILFSQVIAMEQNTFDFSFLVNNIHRMETPVNLLLVPHRKFKFNNPYSELCFFKSSKTYTSLVFDLSIYFYRRFLRSEDFFLYHSSQFGPVEKINTVENP